MSEKEMIRTRLFMWVVVSLFTPLILLGCGSHVQEGVSINNETMGMSPLPKYRAGTVLVYSNGTWEQVTSIEGDSILWRDYKGRTSTGIPDFTYARNQWENSEWRGTRRFVQDSGLLSGAGTGLWPLGEGKSNNFSEYSTAVMRSNEDFVKESDRYWRCSVGGAENIDVTLGNFNAWRITCTRYSDISGKSRKRPREFKTWYYVPELNHWVVEIRDYRSQKKQDKRKELVAILPDLNTFSANRRTRAALEQSVQKALEKRRSGTSEEYINKRESLKAITTPLKTFRHESGKICRSYVQHIESSSDRATFSAVACRDRSGEWKVPRREV